MVIFNTHVHWLQLVFIAMGIADNTNSNKRSRFNIFVKKEGCFENKIRRWQSLYVSFRAVLLQLLNAVLFLRMLFVDDVIIFVEST